MKKRKLLLTLGSFSLGLVPIFTIISCAKVNTKLNSKDNDFYQEKLFNQRQTFLTNDVQIALDAIDQSDLNISVDSNGKGTIDQATLDALATGNLANVNISANKMTNIFRNDQIILTATPKSGYVFSDGKSNLTHQITIDQMIAEINTHNARITFFAIDQSDLNISVDSNGKGTIDQATLDALATGNLANVIISANKMTNIFRNDQIILTATPKQGYVFHNSHFNLTHSIVIGRGVGVANQTIITTNDAQSTLDAIDQNALSILNNNRSWTIDQATLDALAIGHLANVTINVDKVANITNNDQITLTATPKPGYAFSGNESNLTHPITITGLNEIIDSSDVLSALNAIDQSDLNISGDSGEGSIVQSTLDALAIGDLANTIIVANEMSAIYNNDQITLIATPKPGYTFSKGESNLSHSITISRLVIPIGIDVRDVQSALHVISENNLNIIGNDGTGTITQAALDALVASDDFIRFIYNNPFHEAALDALTRIDFITISANKMTNIANGDTITLTITPKPGYIFSGSTNYWYNAIGHNEPKPGYTFNNGKNSLTCQITISGLPTTNQTIITTNDAQSTLDAIDQNALSILNNDGSLTIDQATLDALAIGHLANVTISADKVVNIANNDVITLTATPKLGYAFSNGKSTLVHQITISGLSKINQIITTSNVQSALNAIDQNALNISNDGSGYIAQTSLDALATGNLANVSIRVNKVLHISNNDQITLSAWPKPGYVFSGGQSSLTHLITISGLNKIIDSSDVSNALNIISRNDKIFDNLGNIDPSALTNAVAKKSSLINTIIDFNTMSNINNQDKIILIATPKLGYTFSGGQSSLTHQITISSLHTTSQTITISNAQNALDAIDQNALNISGNDGLGFIAQTTLDAFATDHLTNVTISANKVTNIANNDVITLTITPKPGYAFSNGQSTLIHQITISGLSTINQIITTSNVQSALNAIDQNALNISNDGSGYIAQTTLDALATGNLANVSIRVNKVLHISNNDQITLSAWPKPGYVFSGGQSSLTHLITISGLSGLSDLNKIIDSNDVLNTLNTISRNDKILDHLGHIDPLALTSAIVKKSSLINTIIGFNTMSNITNQNKITLTASPKSGYTFSGGELSISS